MTDFWNKIFTLAENITVPVGTQLLQDFGKVQAQQKSDGSLVTKSDIWADGKIREAIAETFPNHGILSEEGEHQFPSTDWCWVVDPLDGTTNFTRGLPLWGISMGLLYQGTPVFGYVYLPTLQQNFYGFWRGSSDLEVPTGAYLNHVPIYPTRDPISPNQFFNLCSRSVAIAPQVPAKIRMLGMASYNFLTVAHGACIGGIEATPKIWDIAGAWPIVQSSGAAWVPLNSTKPIFPLQPGENYADRSFPTLVVSQPQLVPTFEQTSTNCKQSS